MSKSSVGRIDGLREEPDGRLTGTVVFAPTERGRELEQLYSSRMQSSFSVSWVGVETRHAKGAGRPPGSLDFIRARLIEISACVVGADSLATVERAQKGDLKGAATALGVRLALQDIEPHVAEIAIREAGRLLGAGTHARSIGDRATFFAAALDAFKKIGRN